MFDQVAFDDQIRALIKNGKEKEAESKLLAAYTALKGTNNLNALAIVVIRLAQLYSMPDTEHLIKAESYFKEHEVLSRTFYARLQTATFYFYVLKDFAKTVNKVDEMKSLEGFAASTSYYSALALKGQALILLGMIGSAGQVLDELLEMVVVNPPKFPFGDELNFLEAAARHVGLQQRSRQLLIRITPHIRSSDYVKKAEILLKSIS